jgi:hypothetical protein
MPERQPTLDEVAELRRVTPRYLREVVRRHQIPVFRIKQRTSWTRSRRTPLGDPFGYSDLRSLGVAASLGDGEPDWEETAANMRAIIAKLSNPANTAKGGRFKRDNRDTLQQMPQGDRDAWSSVEHRLGDRDRELREGRNE